MGDDFNFKVEGSPFFWREKAEELKFASEILWPNVQAWFDEIIGLTRGEIDLNNFTPKPSIYHIYLSLIGFSTECLFKACIIRDHPEFISNGTLAKGLHRHDLLEYAKDGNIILSKNEQIFCKAAQRAMTTDSRYPIAKKAADNDRLVEVGVEFKGAFEDIYNRIYPNVGQLFAAKRSKSLYKKNE